MKFAKNLATKIGYVGYGFGAFNAYKTNKQYKDRKISKGWMQIEQTSNVISTFGGTYGAAWGVGWEIGRGIAGNDWYRQNVRPYIQDVLDVPRD